MRDRKDIKKILAAGAAIVFLCSTVFFSTGSRAEAVTEADISEESLGEMCIKQVMPVSDPDDKKKKDDKDGGKETVIAQKGENIAEKHKRSDEKKSTNDDSGKSEKGKSRKVKVSDKPLVVIYHTHSSESYMPYKESNYHREKEKGTVRDVGSVMKKELESRGIKVIHDKTLHDRPSYNDSYNRSLETITALRKKYPTADYVIDLHRDAAPASASEGKYIKINGRRVAKFSLVVGQQNENYVELYSYAKKISEKAGSTHSGFGGAIIERNYKYNEYVSNRSLLLEIGNNKNTIEEARLCGKHFAEVLASVIEAEKK